MSSSLYLQESRQVPTELGFGLAYDFGRVNRSAVREALAKGDLLLSDPTQLPPAGAAPDPTCEYDEVAGHFMGRLDRSLGDTPATATETSGTWTAGVRTMLTQDGTYAAGYEQADDGEWSLTFTDQPWGACKHLWFVTYDKAQSPLVLEFGRVWQLTLHETGQAQLSKLRSWTVNEGTESEQTESRFEPVALFDWLSAPEFAPGFHWLGIYQNRRKLVIRNLAQNPAGRSLGVAVTDEGDAIPEDAWDGEPEEYPVDEDGTAFKHAIRGGDWTIRGNGKVTVGLPELQWVAATSTLQSRLLAASPGGSTRPCEVTLCGQGSDPATTATVELHDQDDETWPQAGNPFSPAKTALWWRCSFTSTATSTYFLSYLGLTVPRVMIADGNLGTDVIALTDVTDKRLVLSREGDLTNEQLIATLYAHQTNLASYVQPNLAIRYLVNGVTVFRGRTRRADWRVIADGATPSGELAVEAVGLWGRFEQALWPGGRAFDGRRLTDCLAEVVAAAGLSASEYDIDDWEFEFPLNPDGEAPTLVYQPGTTVARILADFREHWYGRYHLQYFRLSDGVFRFTVATGSASPAMAFYQTSAAAAAAGVPHQVILDGSYTETLDQSEQANYLVVVGQGPDGKPVVSRALDWPSVNDRTADNYVAEVWPLVVSDPSLQTQAAVDLVCRRLYEKHRNPRVFAQWKSIRTDVFPGDVVTLSGSNYGVNVRLNGISFEQAADGDAADPNGRASYSGEVVS